ncbi:MAG: tetratricopeptide repeat protein [Prevotella sp.]|nr:tetratricopeptide repeat protein [Prevotella sp.]
MENNRLQDVYGHLLSRNLPNAMDAMENYLSTYLHETDRDRLYAIRSDFQLMADYWKRGYKDPQVTALYENLLRRMYALYVQVSLEQEVRSSTNVVLVHDRILNRIKGQSVKELQVQLEGFVSDVAILELEPAHTRKDKEKIIYQDHHCLMRDWFDYLWLSPLWSAEQTEDMERLLLAPTIDSRDQQLLISGMTLSVVNHFDVSKLKVLINVYKETGDEGVRQRALVGWVLALGGKILPVLYPEVLSEIEAMLEDEAVCQELVELQQQIYLCQNAEKDHQTIQEEIMPELLNNSHFRVTRNGIEEMEEDSMEDILHPGAEEQRMEKLEENYRRMIDMQKQGSDIYFGGFSQMKRFPFFRDAINWFVPFYMEHPGIAEVTDKFASNRFLKVMMNAGPFCNSDKYSFLLAFSQVVERMPKDVLKMFENGEAVMEDAMGKDTQTPAYIRRSYLQDLYRFYRLFNYRSQFCDPFMMQYSLFFSNVIFSHTRLAPYFGEVVSSLMKLKRIDEAKAVLNNTDESQRDLKFYLITGYIAQNYRGLFDSVKASVFFQKALALDPKNERALYGIAKQHFMENDYQTALDHYEQLLALQPDKRSYLLNHAVCLTKLLRYQDALKELYQLNYENPDDRKVNKVLAWTLTCDGKYEQAIKIYQQLLDDPMQTEDLLNYGYCLWFSGNMSDAADCFSRYLKETGEQKNTIIETERDLIEEKGITEAEQQMMLYML